MAIAGQPSLPFGLEVMTWRVVYNEKDLLSGSAYEVLEEVMKGFPIEDFGEHEFESWMFFQGDRPEDMGCLSLAEGINVWLSTYARPSSMQGSIEPKAGFVFEHDYSAASAGFF